MEDSKSQIIDKEGNGKDQSSTNASLDSVEEGIIREGMVYFKSQKCLFTLTNATLSWTKMSSKKGILN